MNALYSQLQWLPQAPPDLTERLRALHSVSGSLGSELLWLAGHALDMNQLGKVAKVVLHARLKGKSLDPLVPFRLAVLSNSTTDLMMPALIGSAVRHGISLEVVHGAYDQVAQEAMARESTINNAKPDAVLFALDYRALPLKESPGNAESASANIQGALAFLQTLRNGIKAHSDAVCILPTFAPPAESLFGSLDRSLPGTLRSLIDGVNRGVVEYVRESGDVLLDTAGLAETVGLADWHDPQLWHMARVAFSHGLTPIYAEHIARIVAALRGKSRKGLILDLDNTIWGGVIGDDGLEGIKVSNGDAIGEAHLAVQRLALGLLRRGVVLAVSSKNANEMARLPFEKHPDMVLKLEHIAAFQANWDDKASNILSIAEQLSLGLDALVFLDDNPVERGLVRKLLPQVAVPELPDEPAYYARTLAAGGYFEAVSFATEDLNRSDYYQSNAKRAGLQRQLGDVDAYLASLDMTVHLRPFDAAGRVRIAQLINKSNQFNLTTRRYTDAEVAAAEADPGVFTLQVRLADVFGDNGMISVVICRPADVGVWAIDTWLMSCRVLGRKVEHVVLRVILERARAAGVHTLVGIYRPTDRNKLVADHYAKLGFRQVDAGNKHETHWELLVEEAHLEIVPIKTIAEGFMPNNSHWHDRQSDHSPGASTTSSATKYH